ncbi:MAG: MBL fold metallo-hydrolase [Ferrimicrobium sp.]
MSLSSIESVRITTLVDNVADAFAPSVGYARRTRTLVGVPSPGMVGGSTLIPLRAEHGLSMLFEFSLRGHTRRLLFDAGISPDGLIFNMGLLDLDPADIDAIVLSHGHFDHTGGLVGLVEALGVAKLPIIVHPHAFRRRRLRIRGGEVELPTLSRRYLLDSGFELIEGRDPSFLFDGAVLITGEIRRVTEFERGFSAQDAWLDNSWIPDAEVLDDQALIFSVAGFGLVVVTGCGHAGVINTCRYAQELTGEAVIGAVIGGYHLAGRDGGPTLERVCDAFEALRPRVIAPMHCTGFAATATLAARFSEAFVSSVVGTELRLQA